MTKNQKIFSLICLLIFAFPLQAENITLVVEGIGDSKANALFDAQTNALRASYGGFISTNLTTLNNQLTKNETVNLVSGTIKDFKILSESVNDFSEPPMTEVLIQVTVSKGQLVSFAKAIGDSVEIQGSLYGAELQLQEINKRNEAVAVEHLINKAEIMPSFFDYEISVGNPKLNSHGEFYISGSMSLKTNQNYINLLKVIRETLKAISMKPVERANYAKFDIPFHRIEIMNIVEPGCLGKWDGYSGGVNWGKYNFYRQGNYSSKDELYPSIPATPSSSCSAEWPNECGDGVCGIGGVEIFFLRSNGIFHSLMEIERRVVKSILEFKLYRKMKSYKKLLFPYDFITQEPGWEDDYYKRVNACKRDTIGTSGEYKDRLHAMRCAARGKEALNEMVFKFILNNDKKLISDNQKYRYLITYKDCKFSEYAFDINRLYHRSNFGHNRLMWANYIEAAYIIERSWGRNDLKYMPGINVDNETGCKNQGGNDAWVEGGKSVLILNERYEKRDYYYRSKYSEGGYYPYSVISPVFTVGRDISNVLAPIRQTSEKIGVFHFYPINSTFAVLRYEDKGKRNELSKLTGYSVELDK